MAERQYIDGTPWPYKEDRCIEKVKLRLDGVLQENTTHYCKKPKHAGNHEHVCICDMKWQTPPD
jgi:hypothetical protein